ncbi:sunset domain-containing protein [Amycolatopsis sp. NPDC004772]
MSIFGQVWLWSLAAFFVGVLLTWLVLVLPLRKSVRRLESSLAQAHADAARTPANAATVGSGTDAFRRREPEPSRQETSYPGTLVAAPPIHRDDVHDDIDEDFAELDAQVPSRIPPEPEPVRAPEPELEEDDPYRSAATQFLTSDEEPERASATQYLAPVGDSFDDEPEPESPALSRLEQLDTDSAGSLFQPPAGEAADTPDWFDDEAPSQRSAFEEPVERTRFITEHPGSVRQDEPEDAEPPQYAFGGDIAESELDVPPETPAEATQVLPKRQPREAVRGGFDAPQPIQPSMRTVERREPDLSGAHSGSLFEPSVQPNQAAAAASVAAPEPPPARQAAGDSVPPGPFGPGSAMPRPGGGAPSDSFAVKASVTALRYCTEESAQFPKMVAEVWFRTAEDAERVGFRPLS